MNEAGISGRLEGTDFTDMVLILTAGKKNCEIRIRRVGQDGCLLPRMSGLIHPGKEGLVYIKDGEIIHAELDDLDGEEAFYSIMYWRRGALTVRMREDFPRRTIQKTVMDLLLEGSRLYDESPRDD